MYSVSPDSRLLVPFHTTKLCMEDIISVTPLWLLVSYVCVCVFVPCVQVFTLSTREAKLWLINLFSFSDRLFRAVLCLTGVTEVHPALKAKILDPGG